MRPRVLPLREQSQRAGVAEEGQTIVRVEVVERKREGGINEKPWKEGTASKAQQTTELAADLSRS